MEWKAVAAFFAALAKALEPYVPEFAALLAGRRWQQADDDAETIARVEYANQAAASHRTDSFDERVQRLKKRGRVRGL